MKLSDTKKDLEILIKRYKIIKNKNVLNEANVRKDFIDPLFEILGWDIRNSREYDSEKYIRGRGYADITLKIDDKPVIFVEAKKFGVIPPREKQKTLYGDFTVDWTEEERQALNYAGRDLEVKWAILTNFERFRLFNAYTGEVVLDIQKPDEYLERIDDLLLLSKENLRNGEIDKIWERRERPDIDREFLNLMNHWRILLAREIYDKFPEMALEDIKFYVQRIIDRLVVIRYAEDKWVLQKPDQLKKALDYYEGTDYADLSTTLINFFDGFDKIHDTKIFEKNKKIDDILKKINDKILAKIINELYLQNFRKFKSDILGSTYEAYLATKLIEKNGTLELESSETARKKMGIYYTPPHIVEYIIKNTLGTKLEKIWKECRDLLEDERYEDAIDKFKEIETIRVLDPACGSGSFLIKAYECIEKYYKKYQEKVEEIKEAIRKEKSGQVKITEENILNKLDEPLKDYHRKILKNNLYGVDLDKVAAEIASINLMLKAIKRGEKLPLILEENIKVGNSIVTGVENKKELEEHSDQIKELIRLRQQIKKEKNPEKKNDLKKYYMALKKGLELQINKNLKNYFTSLEEIKPFNYELEFPEVFYNEKGELRKDPGFDVVIGNPPYLRYQRLKHLRQYLKSQYKCYHGAADLYVYFMERGLRLLKKNGFFSYITSNKYTRANYGQKLRKWIWQNFRIVKYTDYSGEKIFKNATVDPAVIIIRKKPAKGEIRVNEKFDLHQNRLNDKSWVFQRLDVYRIKEKIEERGIPLVEWDVNIHSGVKSGFNDAFIISENKKREILGNCRTEDEKKRTEKIIKPILRGRDIKRYFYEWKNLWLIETFPALKLNIKMYPSLKEHLLKYKNELENRSGTSKWFEIRDTTKFYPEFEKDKILWQEMSSKPSFAYDDKKFCPDYTAYFITGENLKYLIGILNSKISEFYVSHTASSLSKGALRWFKQYVEHIPVPPITKQSESIVKEIEKLVDQIILLNKQKEFLLDSFKNLTENMGQKRFQSPLRQYLSKNALDYYINPLKKMFLIDREKMGIPRSYEIRDCGSSLIISVNYADNSCEDVIRLYFDDETLKEFFHLAISINIKGKKKAYRTQKKILDTVLSDIKLPRSRRNKEEDVKNIRRLMQVLEKGYKEKLNTDFKDSPVKNLSLQKLDDKIKETDKKIDRLVYELYGFTEDEIKIIDRFLGKSEDPYE